MPMPAHAHARRSARGRPERRPAVVVLATLLLCAACSRPEPPDTNRPPEPQATTQGTQPANGDAATAGNATELRDAIQQPIDRAKAVDGQVEDAAAKQRAAVDAQTGY